ncbi:uncharacterized protein BX664DRAFT_325059 [Halteromyces radiatus]|uniref:uncharacterized protein n=1 Tax=Halteromyces radiatus TaxID=101107 RepID=UPI00221F7094|nr:uncharacterized protein BX664DRAFT_325059 [Halteromyces radiatus]KAI8096861.1 hypothetical protein BX664DRAFT_325059 [Halteromyces radiatus]
MSKPSLKIKLRLSSPLDSKVSTPQSSSSISSTSSSPKQMKSESPSNEPLSKRSRVRSKKTSSILQGASSNTISGDTSTTTNPGDDQGLQNTNANRSQVSKSSPRIRAIFTHKDTPTRKWQKRPLKFYTLGGGEVQLPTGCWRSDEDMKLNKRTTEPTSVADIDQLFAVEKDFRPFLCTHVGCSKSFTSFDLLQTHETNMHGIKKMVCGIDGCSKGFATSGQLTKHRKMVHFRAARKAKKLAEAEAAASAAAADSANTTANGDNADTPMTTSSTQAMDEDFS